MDKHHNFRYSFENPDKCAICSLAFDVHDTCEFCGYVSQSKTSPKDDIFYQDINGTKSVICYPCIEKNTAATVAANELKQEMDSYTNKVGLEYVPIDYSITFRQDLYNTKVASIEEMRKQCSDESVFIAALTKRYDQLKDIVHTSNVEQLAIAQRLRDIGALHREEIRNALRDSDAKYRPEPPKKINVKIKKEKISPLERIVQTIAMAKNIPIEKARKLVMSNPDLINMSKPGAEFPADEE